MISILPVKFYHWVRHHRLVSESAGIAGAMLLGKAASLLWKIVTASLGIQVLGEIEFILTTTNLLAALAILGVPMAVTIWTAKRTHHHQTTMALLKEVLIFSLITSCLITGLAGVVFYLWPTLTGGTLTPPAHYLYSVPAIVVIEILSAWFNGKKSYFWFVIGKYLGLPVVRLIGLSLLLFWGLSTTVATPQHLNLAVGIVMGVLIWQTLQHRRTDATTQLASDSWPTQRPLFWKQSALLSGSLMLYVVYTASDIYWLNYFFSPTVVGIFSLTLAMTSLVELVFFPVLNLLQTRLSAYDNQPTQALQFLKKNILASGATGCVAAGGLIIGQSVLLQLFGAVHLEIPQAVIWGMLAWKLLANSIVLPIRHYLDFFGQQTGTLYAMVGSFGVKLGLSAWIIPSYGILGVVAVNMAVEILHAIWVLLLVRQYHLRNRC